MAKVKPASLAVNRLTVDDLARSYTLHREALVRRATRKLGSQALAEEIVQEAFLKVILAAPEISTEDHLAAYLNTTVNNLCISHARMHGARPDLVAIDADMTADQVAALLESHETELDGELIRAEDAAVVREAISRLSEADRAVLLAETYEGLTASEISQRYGMTPESVHVAISRARRNLRSILETWVVDTETGMTAAQFLSKSYKKAAENSKKIGTAALSLVLLLAAFFGFWNNPTAPVQVASPNPVLSLPNTEKPAGESPATAPAEATVPTVTATPVESMQTWAVNYLSKVSPLGWPGLDSNGIPVGFTVNNGAGLNGLGLLSQEPFVMNTNTGVTSTTSRFTTFQDGLNVILTQKVTNSSGKVGYSVEPMVRVGGSWVYLEISSISTDIKRLTNGTYLITAWMIVDLDATAKNSPVAGTGVGKDLGQTPAVIATRLLTTEIGSPVIAQAVQVLDPVQSEGGQ